jgi:dTDP-glucose 4,6-dehydratase
MKWLVTGGAGFIGSNFVRLLLAQRPDAEIVNLDLLTYAGNLENLRDIEGHGRHRFVKGDVAEPTGWSEAVGSAPDYVVHFAAETHVDRSIHEGAHAFLRTNVMGTQALLDWVRAKGVKRFVQVGTDEVYGSLAPDDPPFTETTPLRPNSPYAASKCAADMLVRAAVHTHGVDAVVTRCSNNYGPYQFPEKFLPLMITNALADEPLPVYGDGLQMRDWIHVDDHNRAVILAAERGVKGAIYNVGGTGGERTNISVLHRLLEVLGKPRTLVRHVADRPGHDRRYAIDSSRARADLGWTPCVAFEDGLHDLVRWYVGNREWWTRVKSGAYRRYYDSMYGARLAASPGEGGGEPS